MKILVWSLVIVGVASLIIGVCSLLLPPGCSQKASNERNASASLKMIATAQADFRSNDRDNNKLQDFWRGDVSGLYGVLPAGDTEMIKLVEISVAAADPAARDGSPGQVHRDQYAVFAPKAGYFYRALLHADEDPVAPSPDRFAACAYPATYPSSGRPTFVISEAGTIYKKDLRGGVPDVFPDAESLKREWSTLD